MSLVTPDLGTFFWMMTIFGIVFLVLRRFAWIPILNALKERENSINEALNSASLARQQIDGLMADQEAVRSETVREKERILTEAREIKEKIIAEAKEKAQQENSRLMEQFREQIENEKAIALNDIKQQVVDMSIRIAEKILSEKMESTPRQEKMIQSQLEEFKLN